MRLERGLTLREVERRCGVSFSTVSLMENKRHAFSLENLIKLAGTYEVPLSRFFQEVERASARAARRHAEADLVAAEDASAMADA
jgi:transcriptional regulator with XRE-family HTH domain